MVETTLTRALALKQEDRFPEIETFHQALHGRVEADTVREDVLAEIPTEVEKAFRLNWIKERASALQKEGNWAEALATWQHYVALEPDDPDVARTEIDRIQTVMQKAKQPDDTKVELEVREVEAAISPPGVITPKTALPRVQPSFLARVAGGFQRSFKQWRGAWLWGGIVTVVIGSLALVFTRPQIQSFLVSSANTPAISSTSLFVPTVMSTTSLVGIGTAAPGTTSEAVEPTQTLRYTETQTPEPTEDLPTPTKRAIAQSMILRGHTGTVWSVAWSPDGTMLASGSEDQTARIWDASNKAEIKILGLNREVESVSWSPDSTQLVTPGWSGRISIWDIDDAQVTRLLFPEIWCYRNAWSPDGKTIVSIKRASLDFISLSTGRSYFFTETSQVSDFEWSPDSSRIATGQEGFAIIWDAKTGAEITRLKPQPSGLRECHIAWSPDNTQLFLGCESYYSLWNVTNGEEIWSFTSSTVTCADWSPYNSMIAVGKNDGGINILDAETGERLHTLAGHASVVHSLDWSPDATKLVSGSADMTIRVWQFP